MKLKFKLFFRTVFECFKRSITPFLMYMFCSMTALACLNFDSANARVILVVVCIGLAIVLNCDLALRYGQTHYQMLISGNIRRNNEIDTLDNTDRKSYKNEMEYRPYKGFAIGFFVCIPVVIICLLYALFGLNSEEAGGFARLGILLVSGWAILPWEMAFDFASPYITLVSCILPIMITGICYIIGAKREEKTIFERDARMQAVNEAGEESNRQKKKRERENRKF